MNYIWFLSILFAIHYLADFFIQVYTWKSSSEWIKNLIVHTITYVFVLVFGIVLLGTIFPSITIPYHQLLAFVSINAVLHFFTDFLTKKLSLILRKHNEITAYVNVIALDQCIHYITLLITFGYFFTK